MPFFKSTLHKDTEGILLPRISHNWAAAAILLPVVVVTISPFLSIDLTYQIRLGDIIRETASVVRTNGLTFTAQGYPWIDQQWGAQVLISYAFEGGWLGLACMRSLLVAGILICVYLGCAVWTSRKQAALLTLGSAMLLLGGFQLRPQIFGMLCFSALFWIVARRSLHGSRLWLAVPLASLWVNLHGSFFLAPLVLLGAFLEDVVSRKPSARKTLFVAMAATLATLANPFGWRVWIYIRAITSNPLIRSSVGEWKPPSIESYSGIVFFISAMAVAVLLARRREITPWAGMLWLLSFFILGLTATRATFWWSLAAPVLVAGILSSKETKTPDPQNRANLAIICLLAAIALTAHLRWLPYANGRVIPSGNASLLYAPVELTQKLQAELSPGDRFFNPQIWGSWFEFQLPSNPVAVDSRFEAFPYQVWDDYTNVSQGRQDWQAILKRWNVRIVVLERKQQAFLIPRITADPAWKLIYEDPEGLIFQRR